MSLTVEERKLLTEEWIRVAAGRSVQVQYSTGCAVVSIFVTGRCNKHLIVEAELRTTVNRIHGENFPLSFAFLGILIDQLPFMDNYSEIYILHMQCTIMCFIIFLRHI